MTTTARFRHQPARLLWIGVLLLGSCWNAACLIPPKKSDPGDHKPKGPALFIPEGRGHTCLCAMLIGGDVGFFYSFAENYAAFWCMSGLRDICQQSCYSAGHAQPQYRDALKEWCRSHPNGKAEITWLSTIGPAAQDMKIDDFLGPKACKGTPNKETVNCSCGPEDYRPRGGCGESGCRMGERPYQCETFDGTKKSICKEEPNGACPCSCRDYYIQKDCGGGNNWGCSSSQRARFRECDRPGCKDDTMRCVDNAPGECIPSGACHLNPDGSTQAPCSYCPCGYFVDYTRGGYCCPQR